MTYRAAILCLVILFSPGGALAERHPLTFVKRIGGGWATDKFGWMSFVAFSPDGKAIASDAAAAPDDVSGNLTVWSFPGGRLIKRLPVRPEAISPDWKYAASSSGVADMETGKPIISLGSNEFALHAFSPDSRYVAETVQGPVAAGARIRILALPSGKQVNAFGRLGPSSIAISPDGVTLASGHWQVIKLWNAQTGKRIAILHGLHRYVGGVSFSKDGKFLAADDGGEVQIWDLSHHKLVRSAKANSYGSTPVFSPDGRFIAVGAYGAGTVSLIDVRLGRVVGQYKVSDIGCGSAAFSPDGRYLVTPSTGGLVTWPYDRGGTIHVFSVRAPRR
jgi:WD40 repeat protein